MNIQIYPLCWFTLGCLLCKIFEGLLVCFFPVGSPNLSCGSELSLCQKWALAKEICWDLFFIQQPKPVILQSSCMLWALPLHAPRSCQALREVQTSSNTSGWFPRKWVLQWHKSMIKIFSKCVKENNLLLLSPSGGNCCLGGLSCALRLEAPALSTESGFEHLFPCVYGSCSSFFPPLLFNSFPQEVPCLLSISSQIKTHLIILKKQKKPCDT